MSSTITTAVTAPPSRIWTPQPAPAHLIIPTGPAVARDLREWEANEIDAPSNERFSGEASR